MNFNDSNSSWILKWAEGRVIVDLDSNGFIVGEASYPIVGKFVGRPVRDLIEYLLCMGSDKVVATIIKRDGVWLSPERFHHGCSGNDKYD